MTGFSDAVEAVEALQKNASYQPDSNAQKNVKENNGHSHPAGDPNAYGKVVGQNVNDTEAVEVLNLNQNVQQKNC